MSEETKKIVVEELEEQTEPSVEANETGPKVQSMKASDIGAILFTGEHLTILPIGYADKFGVEGKVKSLSGTDLGSFDLGKLAGAFERVTELEKTVASKDAEIAKMKAEMEKPAETEEKPGEEPPAEEDKPTEEDEKKAEEKQEEKDSAEAKSVKAENEKTSEDHSVDEDIVKLTYGMKYLKEKGQL